MRTIIEERHAPLISQGVGDEALSAIVDRGLAKIPRERWPSMRELGKALACWLLDRGVTEDVCDSSLGRVWLQDRSVPPPPGDGFDASPRPSSSRPPKASPPSGGPIAPSLAPPGSDPRREAARRARPLALTLAIAVVPLGLLGGGGLWLTLSGGSPASSDELAAPSASSYVLTTGATGPQQLGVGASAVVAEQDAGVPSDSSVTSGDGTDRRSAEPSCAAAAGAASATMPDAGEPSAPSQRPGTANLPKLKTPKF
jgi:serine/threonine-protein kinase